MATATPPPQTPSSLHLPYVEQVSPFFRLPLELRLQIVSYILPPPTFPSTGFRHQVHTPISALNLILDYDYRSSPNLTLLLTCRQFSDDFTALAFRRTQFIITDTFTPFPERASRLLSSQIQNLRHIALCITGRHLRNICTWKGAHPFDNQRMRLESLSLVFHNSAHYHYPNDHTTALVALLRRLENVQTLRFIRNGANVKGFFKTWYNRLVGLILKEDHWQRYDAPRLDSEENGLWVSAVNMATTGKRYTGSTSVGSAKGGNIERTWWEWRYDDAGQWFELRAQKPKKVMPEEEYMRFVRPLVERLMEEMQGEEEDLDPRVRNGT